MTWHTFPHVPEEGAHIMVIYKECFPEKVVEMTVREGEWLGIIKKWCYYEDYQFFIKKSSQQVLQN